MRCTNGRVYAWGSSWAVGNDLPLSYLKTPTLVTVLDGHNIVDVQCGANHILALEDDGSVWHWGTFYKSEWTHLPVVTKMDIGFKVKAIACGGGDHSLMLDTDGQCWAFGLNDTGQCGTKCDENNCCLEKPTLVRQPLDEDQEAVMFSEVHASNRLSIGVDAKSGFLYVWGSFRCLHREYDGQSTSDAHGNNYEDSENCWRNSHLDHPVRTHLTSVDEAISRFAVFQHTPNLVRVDQWN